MIEVKVNGGNFEYDIHSLVKAFYPGEEVVVREKEEFTEDAPLQMDATVGDKEIQFQLFEERAFQKKGHVYVEDPDRRLVKNQLKRLIYQVLSEYTGKTLPWGTLTGIRPVKIPMALLEEGKSNVEIADFMRKTYLCSDAKTALAVSIANREREVLKEIDYREGYSLYVGIPFCPSICLYCSFSSSPVNRWEKRMEEYLNTLFRELKFLGEVFQGRKLNTIYVGGGTPTTLTAEQLNRLLDCLEKHFDYSYLKELTVEAGRPDSVTSEKFRVLKRHGVTRVSVNPQTMNQKTLDLIGRQHTVEQTREAYWMAREAGFDNINMDLIVGLPGEDLEEVRRTMEELRVLDPDSITVHSLAIKRAARLNTMKEVYKDLKITGTQEMIDLTARYAKDMGMEPYYLYRQKNMAGNFENVGYARPGKACLYNVLIMEEQQTIVACGAGTISQRVYPDGRIERCENVKEVAQYMERIHEMTERKRKLFSQGI